MKRNAKESYTGKTKRRVRDLSPKKTRTNSNYNRQLQRTPTGIQLKHIRGTMLNTYVENPRRTVGDGNRNRIERLMMET